MRGCGLAALACCFSTIRICSHGGKTRGFQRALYYAIVLPEPFQNGTASISLVMPVVRGNVRMHREMVFPKGGTLVLPPPPEGVRTSQFWLTDETAYSGAQRQVYEGIDRVFWQRHCVVESSPSGLVMPVLVATYAQIGTFGSCVFLSFCSNTRKIESRAVL